MSKPSDVSQDVWDAAWKALRYQKPPFTIARVSRATDVARAILAEREACAQIAETATRITYMHWDPEGLDPVGTKIDYREKIAAAIRNRS